MGSAGFRRHSYITELTSEHVRQVDALLAASERERRKFALNSIRGSPTRSPSKGHQPVTDYNIVTAVRSNNINKNRYSDILPYEKQLVKLPSSLDNDAPYINASYVNAIRLGTVIQPLQRWIATQGPVPNTCNTFWTMCFDLPEPPRIVVQLCALVEAGVQKCAAYMPIGVGNSQTFNSDDHSAPITVTLVASKPIRLENSQRVLYNNNTVRLQRADSDPIEIQHIEFLGWPDHGVPESPQTFITFLRDLSNFAHQQENPASPILIHCSAGVGRTGTTIVLANLMAELAGLVGFAQVDPDEFAVRDPVAEAIDAAREQRCCSVFPHLQFFWNLTKAVVQSQAQVGFVRETFKLMWDTFE